MSLDMEDQNLEAPDLEVQDLEEDLVRILFCQTMRLFIFNMSLHGYKLSCTCTCLPYLQYTDNQLNVLASWQERITRLA